MESVDPFGLLDRRQPGRQPELPRLQGRGRVPESSPLHGISPLAGNTTDARTKTAGRFINRDFKALLAGVSFEPSGSKSTWLEHKQRKILA